MKNRLKKDKKIRQFWLRFGASFLLLLSGLSLAQQSNQATFSSADKASDALFAAVQSNNEDTVLQVLGGSKDLVSSGDTLDDQHDRDLFVDKYRQMHRVVEEPDGTSLIYIGAENWPFPVPLVSKNGKWYFDADAGAKEVLFRRVGENEANTLHICRSLAAIAKNGPQREASSDDAVVQYTRTLIEAEVSVTDAIATPGQQSPSPLNGYYFRKLGSNRANTQNFIIVAYPAEYRSSGLITFIAVPNGLVYEKDLGPQTATVAKAMSTWKPDRSWHIAK